MSTKRTNKTKVDVNEEVCEGVCYHTAAVQLISYLTRRLSHLFFCHRPILQTVMFSAPQTSNQRQSAVAATATTMLRFVYAFRGTWCIMGDLTRRLTQKADHQSQTNTQSAAPLAVPWPLIRMCTAQLP